MISKKDDISRIFDAACNTRKQGDPKHAVELFEDLLSQLDPAAHKWVAGTHGALGDVYLLDLFEAEKAEQHFRQALKLRPVAEHASTGLYFSLVDQGKLVEALEEMVRFLALKDSSTYRDAVREVSSASGRASALLEEARALLRGWTAGERPRRSSDDQGD